MESNEKSWIENYVHSLCPKKIIQEKVDEEIEAMITSINELFSSQASDKHVEFIPDRNLIIFPGVKTNIFIMYNVDAENNELKIVQHKGKELSSSIKKSVSINCKGEKYIVKDQPSIAMDEESFSSLKKAVNYAFSKILN